MQTKTTTEGYSSSAVVLIGARGRSEGGRFKGRRLLGLADLVNGPPDAHQDSILGEEEPLMRKPPTDLQPGV